MTCKTREEPKLQSVEDEMRMAVLGHHDEGLEDLIHMVQSIENGLRIDFLILLC